MLVSVGKSWTCFALTNLMPGLSTSAYSTNWEVIFTSVMFLSMNELLRINLYGVKGLLFSKRGGVELLWTQYSYVFGWSSICLYTLGRFLCVCVCVCGFLGFFRGVRHRFCSSRLR